MRSTVRLQAYKQYAYDGLLALLLFVVTALTVFPIFQGDYTSSWGSIEPAFLSEAQFIASNYPNIGWYPYWYMGFPFPLIYVPLLPYAVALMHVLIPSWSIGHSYRVLTALGYSASPPALYALAKHLSKKRSAGFIAGLSYALVPTFLRGLVPSHVEVLAIYGEGPHILSLPFLVLSELQFLRCIQSPTLTRYVTFAVLMAALALTNVIGLFAFGLIAVVTLLAETIFGTIGRALRVLLLSGALALGLVAFQYTSQYILALAAYGDVAFSFPSVTLVFSGIVVGVVALIARSYGSRSSGVKPYFLALLWVVVFGSIVVGRQLWGMTLAPQPIRYAPEFDMGISIVLGLCITSGLDAMLKIVPTSMAFRKGAKVVVMVILMIVLALTSVTLLQISFQVTQPAEKVADTPEFQVANWLAAHVTDERIYASGTIGFWLNVFSPVQQIRGGSDGAGTNKWWGHVTYQINNGPDPTISILWAQALNVKYIVVAFPNASTAYHDFAYPDKFMGVLPLQFYYEGFGVYEVPLRQGALVQCVSADASKVLNPIHDVLDIQGISSYVALTDSACGKQAHISYTRINADQIRIVASNATQETAILVKMTYDEGWRAEVNGHTLPLTILGPGFMIAYPQLNGNYQITLHFESPQGQVLGLWVSIGALLGILVAAAVRVFGRTRISWQNQPAPANNVDE
jgi:hypothetical protein